MCIKKLSQGFKKSYRLIAMMMIAASLLGVSYGYWSDEHLIKTEVQTPKVELQGTDNTVSCIEAIRGKQANEIKDNKNFNIDIQRVNGKESDICIEYFGCEIYFEKPYRDKILLVSDKDRGPWDKLVKGLDVIKSENKYEIKISMDAKELNSLLIKDKNAQWGNLKIKLHFKQSETAEKDAWKYSTETIYPVRFIRSFASMNDEEMQVNTILTDRAPASEAPASEAPASGTPASGTPASEAPASGAPASGAPASGTPVSGAPASGASASGTPVSEAPASGAPASGAPVSEAPASEAPASEAPTSGTSASGAPASEAPASGAPASKASTSGAPASEVPASGAPASEAPASGVGE